MIHPPADWGCRPYLCTKGSECTFQHGLSSSQRGCKGQSTVDWDASVRYLLRDVKYSRDPEGCSTYQRTRDKIHCGT